MHLKQTEINILKAEIEYAFGRKIASTRDCIDLSNQIFQKTSFSINANTIRRFFQLVKSSYPASIATLNILAIYCGSASIQELIAYKKSTVDIVKGDREALLRYLEVMFKDVSVANTEAPTFIKLVHTTIDFLNQNLDIAYEFQKIIVKTNNVKRFYFEHFVNIDKLNSFYGNGLRYYLAENNEADAQIFGYALLSYRYWLNMDIRSLQGNHIKLMAYKISQDIPLFICARYFAARLFFAEAMGLDAATILREANVFYNNAKALNAADDSLACFELDFSEALILTNRYKEALEYITEGMSRNFADRQIVNINTNKNFKLYQAIVLTKLGDQEKAAEIFDQLRPMEFYFITKNFQAIFYFSLGISLHKLERAHANVDLLIEQTGFVKMKNMLAVA